VKPSLQKTPQLHRSHFDPSLNCQEKKENVGDKTDRCRRVWFEDYLQTGSAEGVWTGSVFGLYRRVGDTSRLFPI